MRTPSVLSLAVAAAALAAPAAARADRRFYGETYDASTAPKGAVDLELWSTLHRAPAAGGEDVWRHMIEVETGLTDRWDVALYNVGSQEQGGPLRYEATKVETRYRLSEPGAWIVDPIVYVEVRKEWIADAPWGVEEKLILGKDVGPLNLSLNASAEQEFPKAGGHELEWGWAVGTSYEVAPPVRVGGEAFGDLTRVDVPGASGTEHHAWAGPALSIAAWRGWVVLAAGWGLNRESESLRLRGILSFQF